jgi:ubiquinone/menaquinone biosynthesis C-methylase UbiE
MDFDNHATEYGRTLSEALRFCGAEVDQLVGYKARLILALLARQFGDPQKLKVLDIGCGIGLIDRELVNGVGELHGTDVSRKSLDRAAYLLPAAKFRHFEGKQLPYSDEVFDFVFAICVLHHVPPHERTAFVSDMARVTRTAGIVFVLEHNPFNPVTRHIVSRCPFDDDAVLLGCSEAANLLRYAGLSSVNSRYITFWPRRSVIVDRLEQNIGWLPLGAQYYAWARKG